MARINSLASGVSPTTATLSAAVLFMAAGTALATPEIASVTRGNVSVAQQGTLTQITASNGSIINYNSFNIPRGTTVQFIQPSATARVLNRINSGSPSRIDGTLTANGRVYLVNPSGVIFGRNSVVNAAAIYASSGNITDSDFTAGRDRFITSGGGVINNGRINAHTVALSGPVVENNGSIVSDRGIVVMAAGDQVTMRPEGSRVAVTVTGHGSVINGEATAAGNDSREPGRTSPVSMMAGDVYGYAVRNSGSIQGGQVTLQGTQRNSVVTSSGSIDVSNANGQGGRVEMTGDRVGVMGGRINADGSAGGGDIRIGGDILGSGPVVNSNQTYIAPGAVISADATNQGAGGIVVLYGTDSLQIGASVTARGGVNGGSGGVIETSTQGTMQLAALPNAAARVGGANEGTWIIDPTDILIDNSNSGDPLSDPFTSSGGVTVTIGAQAIESVLNAGNNISIITGAGGGQAGNITVDGSIDINPASGTPTLTLNAINDIVFTSSGQIELLSGSATVNLIAGGDVSLVGNFGSGVTSGAIINSATGTVGAPATLTLNITAPLTASFANTGGGQIINTIDNSTAAIDLTLNGGDGSGVGLQPDVQWDSAADFGNAGSVTIFANTFANSGQIFGGSSVDIRAYRGVSLGANIAANSLFFGSGYESGIDADITISNGVLLSGNSITLLAGGNNNNLANSGAIVVPATGVVFSNVNGTAAPDFFNFFQDASISDAIAVARFQGGSVSAMTYHIRSLENDVTIATAANVANSILTLTADDNVNNFVNINTNIAPTSLISDGQTNLDGNVTTTTGQIRFLDGRVRLLRDVTLTSGASNIIFEATAAVDSDDVTTPRGLTMSAGSNVQLLADAGATNPLAFLTSGGANNGTFLNVTTTGAQNYNNLGGITWVGTGYASNSSGNILVSTPLTLEADAVVATGGNATFSNTINTGTSLFGLTVNADGITTFDGVVGAVNALNFLTTNGDGSLAVNQAVTTVGNQTYGEQTIGLGNNSGTTLFTTTGAASQITFGSAGTSAITLNGSVNASTPSTGAVVFSGQVDGARDIITNSGSTTFAGAVGGTTPLSSVDVTGATVIQGTGIATTGQQVYTGAMTIAADVMLSAVNNQIVINGDIDSDDAVQDRDLTINTAGLTRITGDVGTTSAVATFTSDGPGTIEFGNAGAGGNVTAVNEITVGENVTFNSNAVFTSTNNGNIAFQGTLNADATANNRTLTVNTGGRTAFEQSVGTAAGTLLSTITTDLGGDVEFGTNAGGPITISTSGAQTYNDSAVVNNNITFSNLGGLIAFNGTLDADSEGANRTFTVNSAGDFCIVGDVGSAEAFATMNIDVGPGSSILIGDAANAITVATTGAQTYSDPVIIRGDVTITSTNNGDISFTNTVDADDGTLGRDLSINTSGITTIGGNVGQTQALGSLVTNAGGSVILGSGGTPISITTTGEQTYNENATLAGNGTFTTTDGGNITFGGTLNGNAAGRQFVANASGDFCFLGNVGNTQALQSIEVDGGANILLGGTSAITITTVETQRYADPVTLRNNVTLVSSSNTGNISFEGTVNGDLAANNRTLTINSPAATLFVSNVGNTQALGSIISDAPGSVRFGNGAGPITLTTSGVQTYSDAAVLVTDTTFASTTNGNITFGGTINSDDTANDRDLVINTGGQTWFQSNVGSAAGTLLATITTNAAGTTRMGTTAGGAITVRTGGTQSYGDRLRLSNNVTINAGTGQILLLGGAENESGNRSLTLTTDAPATQTSTPIVIGGSMGSSGSRLGALIFSARDVSLINPTGPNFATVVFSSAANSLNATGQVLNPTNPAEEAAYRNANNNIFANTFTMGAGQRLFSVGNLNITGNTASLADITSLNGISVTAPGGVSLSTRTRADANNQAGENPPVVQDDNVSIVAAGPIVMPRPTNVGALGDRTLVIAANNIGLISGGVNGPGGLSPRDIDGLGDPAVSIDSFRDTGINPGFLSPFIFAATGLTGDNPVTSIAGAIPREALSGAVNRNQGLTFAQIESLRRLSVNPEPSGFTELVGYLVGRRLYNDAGRTGLANRTSITVSRDRFDVDAVERALTTYNDLVSSGRLESYGTSICNSFRASGAQDAGSFESYLNANDPQSLAGLNEIRTLVRQLRAMGLTDYEWAKVVNNFCNTNLNCMPAGISLPLMGIQPVNPRVSSGAGEPVAMR